MTFENKSYDEDYQDGWDEVDDIIKNKLSERFERMSLVGLYGFYKSPRQQEALKSNGALQALGDYLEKWMKDNNVNPSIENLTQLLNERAKNVNIK